MADHENLLMMRGELSNLFGRKPIDCLTWLGYDRGKQCPTVIFMRLPTGFNSCELKKLASRARMLLENIGRKGDLRASIADVEEMLVAILNSSGEKALNELRDQAAGLASPLGAEKSLGHLRTIIGMLLGTYSKGELTTKAGRAISRGTPVDPRAPTTSLASFG